LSPSPAPTLTAESQRFRDRLASAMDAGVLAFPLTPFSDDGARIEPGAYRDHLERHIAAGASALFVACGTGEFPTLGEQEFAELVGIAVDHVAGRVPVLAGVGYGWAQATRFARIAEDAGVDGALVLPHYLVEAPAAGIVRQVEEIASRTPLPLVVYQRGLVSFTSDTLREVATFPNVIGLKDGRSDHGQLQQLVLAAPEGFLFFNGALTAEMQARAYAAIGISAYSSAAHAFAPEIASAFFRAQKAGDDATMDELLREFYIPLVRLRDRQAGFAVALIKAGARLRGENVGPVRAPLLDPAGQDLADLEAITRRGLELVGASF